MARLRILSVVALSQVGLAERMGTQEYSHPLAEEQISGTRQPGDVIDGQYTIVQELEYLSSGYGLPIDKRRGVDSVMELNQSTNASQPQVDGYQATKMLGAGAYGRVFLVEDRESPGKLVALKEVLRPTDDWYRRATYNECKLMMDVHRPQNVAIDPVGASRLLRCLKLNINYTLKTRPNLKPFGGLTNVRNQRFNNRPKLVVPERPKYIVPGPQYIILEHAGRPLRLEQLEYEGAIVKQLLQGIRYLARLGYSHRDLKHENVLIQYLSDAKGNPQPIIKIIDFGLSTRNIFCNGIDNACSVNFQDYHWSPPEMQDSSKFMLASTYPYMTADAYDLWSLGLIIVDQVCNEGRAQVSEEVRLLKKQQWTILKRGLQDAMDYENFFCGTGKIKYAENWAGFWPTVCNIKCEDFYQDKRLRGFAELITFALQQNPEKRSFLRQARDLQTLKAKNVPETTYYVPMRKHGYNILEPVAPNTFRVVDDTGKQMGVALRVSKLLETTTPLTKSYGSVFVGKDLGDGWVETKELTPKLGVETLMPLVCSYHTYLLPLGGSVAISDEEDFEHDFAACKVGTI